MVYVPNSVATSSMYQTALQQMHVPNTDPTKRPVLKVPTKFFSQASSKQESNFKTRVKLRGKFLF